MQKLNLFKQKIKLKTLKLTKILYECSSTECLTVNYYLQVQNLNTYLNAKYLNNVISLNSKLFLVCDRKIRK